MEYLTLSKEGIYSEIIERSKFIAYAAPVKSKDEAEEYILKIREKHKDASHNVPVIVLGERQSYQWASEDGEPQGTAGQPILKMLLAEGLTDLVVVVSRYFGGIKLGTGGLVRAYTKVAKEGLAAAGITEIVSMESMEIEIDYQFLDRLKNISESLTDKEGRKIFELDDIDYLERVKIRLVYKADMREEIMGLLKDLTGGKINFGDVSEIKEKFDKK